MRKQNKLAFSQLNEGEKAQAISEIFELHEKYNWPNHKDWENLERCREDIESGEYDPGDHFSIYIDHSGFSDVIVKIS